MSKITTIFSESKKKSFPGKFQQIEYQGNLNFMPESSDHVYHNKSQLSEMNAKVLENKKFYYETTEIESVAQFENWNSNSCRIINNYDHYLRMQEYITNPTAYGKKRFEEAVWANYDLEMRQKAQEIALHAIAEIVDGSVINDLDEFTKLIIKMQTSKIKEFIVSPVGIQFSNVDSLTSIMKFSFTGPVFIKIIRLILFFAKVVLSFCS